MGEDDTADSASPEWVTIRVPVLHWSPIPSDVCRQSLPLPGLGSQVNDLHQKDPTSSKVPY